MALGTPSSAPEIQKNSPLTSSEAQARVNTVANDAIAALSENRNKQEAVKNLFGKMVTGNLRDPESVGRIQDGLYNARDTKLANASPIERLAILESFSTFMEKFTEGIAQMNRDIPLSNELNNLTTASDAQMSRVKSTYEKIITQNHPTFTA